MPLQNILEPTELQDIAVQLASAIVMGEILAWHYVRYAKVLANKRKFARIFTFVACTTLLIISVVKVSLQLSLGLVGAMSIIRFRTPIKEPEELSYLFLAIAVGVGLGADQAIATALIFVVLLVFLALRGDRGTQPTVRTLLHFGVGVEPGAATAPLVDRLMPMVEAHCDRSDLRRVDVGGSRLTVAVAVEVPGREALTQLLGAVEAEFPGAEVTFLERSGTE